MIDYRSVLSVENLLENFPWNLHPEMRDTQHLAFEHIAQQGGSITLEAPTGTGKTDIGYTLLRTVASRTENPVFYVTTNKALVNGIKQMYPDVSAAYGRNEYDCLYYAPEIFRADEVPCLSLDCPHRVDQESGRTQQDDSLPCPYYQAKYRAKSARIVVCTASFYLFTQLFSREFERPAALVLDEAHQIAQVVRGALSYEITDANLQRGVTLLQKMGAEDEAKALFAFKSVMIGVLRGKPADEPVLLKDEEIIMLMNVLKGIDANKVRSKVTQAIRAREIDPLEDRELLKQLESLTYDLYRYVHSFEYALPGEDRHPLNYVTYAYSLKEPVAPKRVQYRLVIKSYHVAPLVRKLLSPMTLAYSATIGDPDVFGFETGLRFPVKRLPSSFSADRTRVFMPTDTADLSAAKRSKREPTVSLRKIARACVHLGEHGIRSLVIVVSNRERDKFMWLANDEGLEAISYDADLTAREAVTLFKEGHGSVLVGTARNYGEGIDLPEEMCPVTFFLRPGYPNPRDPSTQFEERRFGRQRWAVWNWRAMLEALQVRGRNVRSIEDRGVTIFVSQQFRKILFSALPEWLQPSYEGTKTFDECVEAAIELMDRSVA